MFRIIEKHNMGGHTKFGTEWMDKIKVNFYRTNGTNGTNWTNWKN